VSEAQTWEEYEDGDGNVRVRLSERGIELAEQDEENVPSSSPADSSASEEKSVGLREMPEASRCEVQPDAEGEAQAADSPAQAIIPTSGKFVAIRAAAGQSGATTLDELSPFNRRALEIRAEEIDSEYEGETLETAFPIQVLETARKWLRSKNLIWASNDVAFWQALEYVLSSLETFSVDAVEQALIICTTQAVNNPARRAAIYQELRACRAIKKIRHMEMRIRTAQVVATHALSAPFHNKAKYEKVRSYATTSVREADEDAEIPKAEIPKDQAFVVYQLGYLRDGVWKPCEKPYGEPSLRLEDVQRLREYALAQQIYSREFEIHTLGVNVEGKIIKDYGVTEQE
jgi:hypothetical protein